MKRLYIIGGPMGVGKSTVSRALRDMLDSCAFLDGDWCWDMHPFKVTEKTKAVVLDNICHTLSSFLGCPEFENVVFCWVLHERSILDAILSRLKLCGVELRIAYLVCSESVLRSRLNADVERGARTPDILERACAYLRMYGGLGGNRLDVSAMTPAECASLILRLPPERHPGM